MKCPIDQSELVMTERKGVEIDYCPKCRGVWLDRGELDKILDRAAATEAPRGEPGRYLDQTPYDREARQHKQYKPKSWLSEIFD
jgi:Zn-finger nucleic acid-binding protein